MEGIFFKILDMSFATSCCIVVVLFLRLFLKKMPKLFSYMLWLIVLVRLLCPVMLQSQFGLLPSEGRQNEFLEELGESVRGHMPTDVEGGSTAVEKPAVTAWPQGSDTNYGMETLSEGKAELSEKTSEKDWRSIWVTAVSMLWFGVCCIILLYSVIAAWSLKRRLALAERREDGSFESDQVEAPFLFGILCPRIYLPTGIEEPERTYILTHERVHIRRKDYLVKPLFFAAATVHWFNPLVWVAWRCMCKDMEMSCDEAVLSQLGEASRKEYSKTLLKLSAGYPALLNGPLAFGENDTKARIRNIGSYKKPVLWAVAIALLIFVIAAVLLLTNRRPLMEEQPSGEDDYNASLQISGREDEPEPEIAREIEEYNQAARELKRGEALTWERLEELAALEWPTLEDYAGYDGAEWSERTGALSSLREELVYYLTDEEMGRWYRLSIPYYIENNAVEYVNLIKDDGSALLLYNSYDNGSGRGSVDILSFRQHEEELSDWVSAYAMPKEDCVAEGAYFPEGGYGYGGIEFTWTGPDPYTTNGREDFGYSVWKAAGGIMRYPIQSIHMEGVLDYESFVFVDGELTEVNIRGLNHTSRKGEAQKIAGCEESAVLFCLNHDLFTASDIAEAEEKGQEIPEDEQTADIWYAAVAREGASYGYIVYLNARYYSKEEAEEFAKSLRFTEQAWR